MSVTLTVFYKQTNNNEPKQNKTKPTYKQTNQPAKQKTQNIKPLIFLTVMEQLTTRFWVMRSPI